MPTARFAANAPQMLRFGLRMVILISVARFGVLGFAPTLVTLLALAADDHIVARNVRARPSHGPA